MDKVNEDNVYTLALYLIDSRHQEAFTLGISLVKEILKKLHNENNQPMITENKS